MKVRHKRHLMRASGGRTEPTLVSGNPKVVAAAKSKESIGEVKNIWAGGSRNKARLDKKSRG